jgi:hypothetical protein
VRRRKKAAATSTNRKLAVAQIYVEKPCGSGYLPGLNPSGFALLTISAIGWEKL